MKDIDLLINALKIIASPYEIQKKYYPDFVCLGDEIANELECREYLQDQISEDERFTEKILCEMEEIDNQFLSISFGEEKYDPVLWEDKAIRDNVFWQKQRERAVQILKELGIDDKLPVQE